MDNHAQHTNDNGSERPTLPAQQSKAAQHSEGAVAKAIETQTAKLPSDTFLWAACGSVAASLVLQLMGRKTESTFVAQWVPTLLILGLYNKVVKVAGSDRAAA
jgi:hypothetical protein